MIYSADAAAGILCTCDIKFMSGSQLRPYDSIEGMRIPKGFNVNCIVDHNKDEILSSYDEENIKWKKILGNLILKGYHKENNIKEEKKENGIKKEEKMNKEKINNEEEDEKDNHKIVNNKNNINLLSDDTFQNNTVDQVQDLLNKIGDKSLKDNENLEEDDVDEDVENYLKQLENK